MTSNCLGKPHKAALSVRLGVQGQYNDVTSEVWADSCLGRSRQSNSSISSGVGTGNCERTGGLRGAWLCVDPVLTTSLLI